jgi:hypothetical protein
MKSIRFTAHAVKRFRERSRLLGLKGDKDELRRLFSTAKEEKRSKDRATSLHFLKREIVRGKAVYLTAAGWRFIVADGRLVGVERVKPHENYPRGESREDYGRQ